MKGLTPQQYIEILDFVQKYHNFAQYPTNELQEERKKQCISEELSRYGLNIKYVDSCYDSRFGDIWSIKFRGLGEEKQFASNTNDSKYANLYDKVMDYLKGK